jgi:hypothetical protein
VARRKVDAVAQAGRIVSPKDLELIKTVVEMFPGLSRRELAATLCEHLNWYTASGAGKQSACIKLLERLEAQGLVALPGRSKSFAPPRPGALDVTPTKETDPPADELAGTLPDIGPVTLDIVTDRAGTSRWNEYVERYHYLGYKKPFGCTLRYFIRSRLGCLGCILLAGAAKSIRVRDCWIGWTPSQRIKNLPWVVNNARFLVLPWVHVKDLASHVLGQLARRIRQDWLARWGYQPVVLETFVDPLRFKGICYQAAGWTCLGQTTGRGLRRPGRDYQTQPRLMFVRPLVPDFRSLLCSDGLQGRDPE